MSTEYTASGTPLVDTRYSYVATNYVEDELVEDMLMQFYGKDAEMDAKIASAYTRHFNIPFVPELADGHISSTYLHGPPGQGKTSVFRSAAKRVCDLLDMNFVDNPDDAYKPGAEGNRFLHKDYSPGREDFLFVSMEMSGEVSSAALGGIPSKAVEGDVSYMKKLVNKRLAMLETAGAGLLLLDDFANASGPIQNVGLSIVEERRFQGVNLGHAYVGVTGNLGSLDGTHTARTSSALDTRCKHYYVEDNLDDFEVRMMNQYGRDELGDGGVVSFLKQNRDLFKTLPSASATGGPFPTSRTWEKLIREMRIFMYMNAVDVNDAEGDFTIGLKEELESKVKSLVGGHAANQMAAWYYALMTGAEPLAKEFMETQGEMSDSAVKKLTDKIKGGHSEKNMDFGYQFAFSLADHAARLIRESKDDEAEVNKLMGTLVDGLFRLPSPVISIAGYRLSLRLANMIPEWSRETKSGLLTLKSDRKIKLLEAAAEHPKATRSKMTVLSEAATGWDSRKSDKDAHLSHRKERKRKADDTPDNAG